jgi:hypothetical protein
MNNQKCDGLLPPERCTKHPSQVYVTNYGNWGCAECDKINMVDDNDDTENDTENDD